jgi:LytS/YehU family sensor histidine kinase
MLTGNYPLSEEHLLKALEIGKTIGSNLQILEADKILSELYSYMQKTELALEHMRESMAYKDSITKEVSRQNSEAMDVLFRAEKQEREIVILKQKAQLDALQISRQKFLIIGIASFVLAIAVIILFFYRQRLLKEKLSQMSLEQKLLRTQLNPHFVFNSLAAVQNYILHNDKIAASDYLVNFSRLMRNILMGSGSDFIPLENELEILNDYLKLQQLRFQNKFDYRFEISNNIEPQTCMVPPMLVQPFVENSIEHGIRGIDRQGLIIIRFNREQNLLLIEVEDNGIGLQEHSSEKQKSNHVSMATKITKQRMQNLQSITKRTCKLEILDKITHKSLPGVLIRIQIPFNEGNG